LSLSSIACTESSTSKKVKIIFYPSIFWKNIDVSSVKENTPIEVKNLIYDKAKNEYYYTLDLVNENQINVSYHGLSVKFDTTFTIDSNTTVPIPFGVKNFYQLEFENSFKLKSKNENKKSTTIDLINAYLPYNENYDSSFLKNWSSDTLYIIGENIGDIAYMGYLKYKIYSSSKNTCTIIGQAKWGEKYIHKTLKMDKERFESFLNNFETMCLEIPYGICMSSTKISFVRKNKIINFLDQSCEWDGFYKLSKLIEWDN